MTKISAIINFFFVLLISANAFAQSDSIVLRDITWDKSSPASFIELAVPSGNSIMQGFIYKANGDTKASHIIITAWFSR
ncbi:MAG: hypothetical protein WKF59_20255 [Chitinophagaceae bacterium]